jgi:D-sedoheptulose 7-phosphate isomerase
VADAVAEEAIVKAGRVVRSDGVLALDLAGAALAAFERRTAPIRELASHTGDLVTAAHAMAARFKQGGKLVIFGLGGASTDAQHVAVEFVRPVIIGKRALPAISLTSDTATVTAMAARAGLADVFEHQIKQLAERVDIALGISQDGSCPCVLAGLSAAKQIGMLTIALVGGGVGGAMAASGVVDHVLAVGSADPRIVKEIHVTAYHLLWELVQIFIEHAGSSGVIA